MGKGYSWVVGGWEGGGGVPTELVPDLRVSLRVSGDLSR